MKKSICDLREVPEFQTLVKGLMDELGNNAEFEAARDYLATDGIIRSPEQIIDKVKNEYFSLYADIIAEKEAKELPSAKTYPENLFKKEVGLSKREVSELQKAMINKRVKAANAKLGTSFYVNFKQVGQADIWTWEIQNKSKKQIINQLENDINREIQKGKPLGLGSSEEGAELLWGELHNPKHNPDFKVAERASGIALRSTITALLPRINNRTFKEVWNSGEFTELERGAILVHSLQQRLANKNSINGKTIRKIEKRFGKKMDIRIIDSTNLGLFALAGEIYVNPEILLKNFTKLFPQMDDIDSFMEFAVFEELIHVLSYRLVKGEDYEKIFHELPNPVFFNEMGKIYKGADKDNQLAIFEFIRAVVQQEVTGTTTEKVKATKGGIINSIVQKIWDFLYDIFKSNNKVLAETIKKHVDFIKETPTINYALESPQTDLMLKLTGFDNTTLTQADTSNARAIEIIQKLADRLSGQVNSPYQIITEEEAIEITKDTANPWKPGAQAFYLGDTAYFVDKYLNTKNVLHEFSHPLLRSVSVENPALFKKLYNDLLATNEGADIAQYVRDNYQLEEGSNLFKEEVLVRAMTVAAQNKLDKIAEPKGFTKVINDLLYAIKQMLRKVFGQKINISKLNENTTLDELAEMLTAGKNFQINTEEISNEDVAAYNKEYQKQVNDILNKDADFKELEDLTNKYFDAVSKQLKRLQDEKKYGELLDIVANKYKAGELQEMKKNLKSYQTKILQDTKEFEDEVVFNQERVHAILDSLQHLKNMTKKIYDEMQEINKDINNKDNVQRMMYYRDTLNYWQDFISDAEDILNRNGAKVPVVSEIATSIRRANDLVNKFNEKALTDVLWDKLKATADNIDAKYAERVAFLTKKNAPQSELDRAKKDYEAARITPETISKALKGELKDANFANSYLEGYSYNTDPAIGGLALYIKDNMTDVEVEVQKDFNVAADELKPLLDKVGYNPNKPGEMGQKLGQKEKVGRVNDKGEFEEVEEWRFINQFMGADLARDQYLFKIKTASTKYGETKSEEDKKALADIQAEWEQHRRDYFHNEYADRFYDRFNLLRQDDIGKEAKMIMDNIYDQINLLGAPTNVQDEIEISTQIEALHRQLRQLSSLYDVAGNPKKGRDLEIAQRVQKFRELSKEFYNTEEIPGAFQNALQNFEQRLVESGMVKGDERYETMRNNWLEANTRIVIKQGFWDKMNDVNARIKELLSKIPQQQQIELDISKAYEEIREMLTGYRDEGGQPLGNEMDEGRLERVKKAQERIIEAQENLTKMSGLSRTEQFKLDALFVKVVDGTATKADYQEISRMMDRKSTLALNNLQRAELRGLFAELEKLRRKEPTDAYVDVVNNHLSNLDTEELFAKFKSNEITKTNAFLILNDEILEPLFEQSKGFETWFKNNHVQKWSMDKETGEDIQKWERTPAWNVIRPNDEEFYEKTSIKDANGNVITEITGLPSMKYYKRLVKDEFITPKIVGKTVDNRGIWLPKSMEDGAKDDRYINKEYFNLQQRDPDLFKLLEKAKELHLKHQEGGHRRSKVYLSFPRFEKGVIELAQTGNLLQNLIERVKWFWSRVKDGWDKGFNFSDDLQLVKMDLFDDETTGIPISGLSNLPIEQVSTDIFYTMMRYDLSLKRQKKLIEIAPVAKALQSVVNNEKNFPSEVKTMKNRSIINLGKKKDKYIRAQAINNLIEREFEGKVNTGFGSDSAVAQNFSNFLFKKASFAYLALNIPSALYNQIGAKLQGLIEAAAGKHMNLADFTAGEAWATATMFKISGEIYKKESKSLDVQLIEIFNPEANKFEYSVGESLSRTPLKDTAYVLDRMNDFRKFTQMQATLQIFAGMMRHQKITQNGKSINYMDAWELKDGKIQLKEGIDKEWGITYDKDGNQIIGEKFKQKRNEMNRVIDDLNGSMRREDSPEANRYLLYRYISFFRRWMTSMFTNRFAYSGALLKGTSRGRYDYQRGDIKEGFYITNLKLLWKAAKSFGKYLPYMTREEKQASLRLMTEVGTLMLMSMLMGLLFDWDPEDENRYAKLREKSGPLAWLGLTEDDPSRPFQLGGWLENHALLTLMQVRQQNEQFIIFPGFGLDDYKQYLDIRSAAFGPTLKAYSDIAQDLGYMITGDSHEYYKRDTGPYIWQQSGSAKILSHLAKIIGLSGQSVDPATAIKNFQNAQSAK